MSSSPQDSGVDKQALYGRYQASRDWRDRLHRQAAHKALDIGDDELAVNVQKSQSGMGWKELAVVAGLTLGGAGLAGYLTRPAAAPAVPPVVQQAPAAPTPQAGPVDSAYEVRFFDAQGNPIHVPHVSQRGASP